MYRDLTFALPPNVPRRRPLSTLFSSSSLVVVQQLRLLVLRLLLL